VQRLRELLPMLPMHAFDASDAAVSQLAQPLHWKLLPPALYVIDEHAPFGPSVVQTCMLPPVGHAAPAVHVVLPFVVEPLDPPELVPPELVLPPPTGTDPPHARVTSITACEQSVHELQLNVFPSSVLYVIAEHAPVGSCDVQTCMFEVPHGAPAEQVSLSVADVTALHAAKTKRMEA
jgi:hypothetical protein